MTPTEELNQLRHRLIGLMYTIAGDVRNVSKGDRHNLHNTYAVTLAEALAEVEKVHAAYAEFCRTQVAKAKETKK